MSRPTDDYIDPLLADPDLCEGCSDRPHVVELDWREALSLDLCVPCARFYAKAGLINWRGVPEKPGRWTWNTTKVLACPPR
jgi:hypothetical protein